MHHIPLILKADELKNSKPLPREFLQELLIKLAVKNQERISSCKAIEYLWSSDAAELVYNFCDELKLKRNVKYLALEIYEKFIGQHVVETRKSHLEILKSRKDSNWDSIQHRLGEQSVLRVLTSVQLASKLESHYQNVLPRQVSDLCDKCSKPFSLNGIFSSEMRVVKTLGYKVNLKTPFEYLELLLYILFQNNPEMDEEVYESALTVLDFVILHRDTVYKTLYENVSGKDFTEDTDFNVAYVRIKADFMLLSSSIIASAMYMFFTGKYEALLEQIHLVTRIMKSDIHNFGSVITYLVSQSLFE